MNIIENLKTRGIFKDITNLEKFEKLEKGVGVYIGFDPTADSLHLGNYIQIATLLRFKKAGFKPFAVLGGATGMIGDPSGKKEERSLLDKETLKKNKAKIKFQLTSFGLNVIDNYDFYKDVLVLDFLRDIGKLININYMSAKEVVASRHESGMSFTEFSYQLIQGYDFLQLYKKENVAVQVGGSDQWGNITTGMEIIRKVEGDENKAVGITTNLLESSNGEKFGKSVGNAIWIDREKTSPYKMYQYLLNLPDTDLEKIFNWTTFITHEEIKDIINAHNKEPFKRAGQKRLAKELITDIFSKEDYEEALLITDSLFGKGSVKDLNEKHLKSLEGSIETSIIEESDIQEAIINSQVASSRREARELISNGSIEINGEKVTDDSLNKLPWKFKRFMLIRKGKKKFFLAKKK